MDENRNCELCGRALVGNYAGGVCPMCRQEYEALKEAQKKAKEQAAADAAVQQSLPFPPSPSPPPPSTPLLVQPPSCVTASVSAPESTGASNLPANVQQSLREHRRWMKVKCLECGYHGPMGVIEGRYDMPWYASLPVIWGATALMIGLNAIAVFVLAFVLWTVRRNSWRWYVTCPACKRVVGPVAGRPTETAA